MRNHPSLFLCLVSFAFFLVALPAAAEFSRSSTVAQPRSVGASTPGDARNSAQSSSLQRQNPATRLKSGFCLVDGAIEKMNQPTCSRKRGQFFPDQKSAEKAADALRGYCCKNGEVKTSTQGSCRRNKGEFFLKENEADRKCAATRGFCCVEGKVSADSKGNCDRKRGQFFIKKQSAETECGKQKGYCCKDAEVVATTQKNCSSQRGTFSLRKVDAQRICDKESGYCCDGGTVSRMTLANCNAKKGQFFSRQIQAQQACKNERGYCCVNGQITPSARGACVQKKGIFALDRSEIADKCKPPKSSRNMQTAAPVSRKTETISGKQKIQQNQKPGSGKSFDDPIFKPIGSSSLQKGGTAKNDATKTQVQQGIKPGTPQTVSGIDKAQTGLVAASAFKAKSLGQSKTTREMENQVAPGSQGDGSAALPKSTLLGIKNPLQVVFIKDRMVRIGDEKSSSGLGSSLTVKNVEANFLCNPGSSPVQAEIAVDGGATHAGLASQLVGQVASFNSFDLQSFEQFTGSFCQQGKKTVHQSSSLSVELSKICRTEEGVEKAGITMVSLPMSVICDLRPDADPADFSANHPSYNINVMALTDTLKNPSNLTGQTIDNKDVQLAIPSVQATSPAAGFDQGEITATLNLKYTSAMVIGDELFMGTPYQSVHEASPVSELKSNIELDVSCGIGVYEEGTLWIKKAGQLQQLQSINTGGKQNLTNVFLMTKTDFLADNCAPGTTYHNLGRNIEFLLEYKCNMPGGATRFEKVLKAPVTMEACDRRNGGMAQETFTAYEHICPSGYHVQSQGPGVTSVFMSTPVPVTCAKTL